MRRTTIATEACKAIVFALVLCTWLYLAAVVAALTVGI